MLSPVLLYERESADTQISPLPMNLVLPLVPILFVGVYSMIKIYHNYLMVELRQTMIEFCNNESWHQLFNN